MSNSEKMFEQAKGLVPYGVHSLGRYATHQPNSPIFMERGDGSRIFDVDGNSYIDYLMAFGPLILGHKHPKLLEAIQNQLEKGTIFGCPCSLSIEVAKEIVQLMPSIDMVLFNNTGSQAVQYALRLARSYTGKNKIIKFEGQYHGDSDSVYLRKPPFSLVGTELKPNKIPASTGMIEDTLDYTIVIPWNNIELLEKIVKRRSHEIAAVITDPIMTGSGVIEPKDGYLQAIREITKENDILLIFDECVTAFRVALGGASEIFGVEPDITIIGKALAGGLPIAAVGGKKAVMEEFAPGKVWFAGTFSGNPLVLASSHATLKELENGALKRLNLIGEKLLDGMRDVIDDLGVKAIVQGPSSFFQVYFTSLERVNNYRDMSKVDIDKFPRLHDELRKNGIFTSRSAFGRYHISAAHTDEDVEITLEVFEAALKTLQ